MRNKEKYNYIGDFLILNKENFLQPIFVGDIGATNARFAYIAAKSTAVDVKYFSCANYESIESLVQAFYDTLSDTETPPSIGALAVACPILGDIVKFTNLPWQFSIEKLKDAFSLDSLFVVNDYAAVAKALPYLGQESLNLIGSIEPAATETKEPKVVLGPGSGLGSASLVPYTWNNTVHWVTVSGEAGHMSLSSQNAKTDGIVSALRKKLGYVCIESVLSGTGIINLYNLLFSQLKTSHSPFLVMKKESESIAPFSSEKKNYYNRNTFLKFEGISTISIDEKLPKRPHGIVDSIKPVSDLDNAVESEIFNKFKEMTAPQIALMALQFKNMDPLPLFSKNLPTLPETPPKEILEISWNSLSYFFQFLGSVAGDLALSVNATGGVYFSGGILPQIENLFQQSNFRAFFQAKGSYESYLSKIPTYLITHPAPALVGLARIAWEKLNNQ